MPMHIPIIPELCLLPRSAYYSKNYTSILGTRLLVIYHHHSCNHLLPLALCHNQVVYCTQSFFSLAGQTFVAHGGERLVTLDRFWWMLPVTSILVTICTFQMRMRTDLWITCPWQSQVNGTNKTRLLLAITDIIERLYIHCNYVPLSWHDVTFLKSSVPRKPV